MAALEECPHCGKSFKKKNWPSCCERCRDINLTKSFNTDYCVLMRERFYLDENDVHS